MRRTCLNRLDRFRTHLPLFETWLAEAEKITVAGIPTWPRLPPDASHVTVEWHTSILATLISRAVADRRARRTGLTS
jgi:hypothetical protein